MSNKQGLLKAFDDLSRACDRNIQLFYAGAGPGSRRSSWHAITSRAVAIPLTAVVGTLADVGYVVVSRSADFGAADDDVTPVHAPTEGDRFT